MLITFEMYVKLTFKPTQYAKHIFDTELRNNMYTFQKGYIVFTRTLKLILLLY